MYGYIQTKQETEPIFNEFGDEISTGQSEETPLIACKYYAPSRTDIALNGGGMFPQNQFVITTKNMNVWGKRFALYDSRKNFICEKDAQSVERLENIQRIKIIL